jgi:hypothetical protein
MHSERIEQQQAGLCDAQEAQANVARLVKLAQTYAERVGADAAAGAEAVRGRLEALTGAVEEVRACMQLLQLLGARHRD